MTIEKTFKEFTFLKKKRIPEYSQLKLKNNIIYQKELNFEILNKLENSKNDLYSYPINNYLTNIWKKSINENNKTKIITEDIINNEPFNILKYFNENQNIIDKSIFENDCNNEIKVFKNRKEVYVNTYLFNSFSTSKNIKKANKINFIIKKKEAVNIEVSPKMEVIGKY